MFTPDFSLLIERYRHNFNPKKYSFEVYVRKVVIPNSNAFVSSKSLARVTFEKNAKSAHYLKVMTREICPVESLECATEWDVIFNEKLSMISTMYLKADGHGSPQEKLGILSLSIGTHLSNMLVIGKINVEFHSIIPKNGKTFSLKQPFKDSIGGTVGWIHSHVTVTCLEETVLPKRELPLASPITRAFSEKTSDIDSQQEDQENSNVISILMAEDFLRPHNSNALPSSKSESVGRKLTTTRTIQYASF